MGWKNKEQRAAYLLKNKDRIHATSLRYRTKHKEAIRLRERSNTKLAQKFGVSTDKSFILGPYKEPLKKVLRGHGYQGALSFNTLGQVQCHECGEMFDNLGSHTWSSHKLSAKDYKEKFQLAAETRLVSERFREEAKNKHLRYLVSLTPEQKLKHRRQAMKAMKACNDARRAKIKSGEYDPGNKSLEQKNKRGICPDQLIDIIRKSHKHYGYTPSVREFEELFTSRYREPINKTFGSWKRAIKKAGLSPRKWGRMKADNGKRYSDAELLEYLSVFYQEHGKVPTAGDCNRGLLPPYQTFAARFGGFPAARKKAKIPDLPPNANHPNTLKNQAKKLAEKIKDPISI